VVFRSGWLALLPQILFSKIDVNGQCLGASWEAGTQIMIVAGVALGVCDGAYGEFVMKTIAAPGHRSISIVGDGRQGACIVGPDSCDRKEVKGPALRFAIGRATRQFSMSVNACGC